MKIKNHLLFFLLSLCSFAPSAFADSRRIEVYDLSQQYWDTQHGETLSGIAAQLLPNNVNLQNRLMDEIVKLNPHAFQDGNPDQMQANIRLWLPNQFSQTDSKADPDRIQVETFSWGNINRPRR